MWKHHTIAFSTRHLVMLAGLLSSLACGDSSSPTTNAGSETSTTDSSASSTETGTDCAPLTDCNGSCVDVSGDAQNCGMCGNPCGPDQACEAGVCTCPTGQVECNDACIDPNTDNSNCGSCGNLCGIESSCMG